MINKDKGKSKFLREPIRHLNLRELENFFDLVQAFQHTSFQSRNIYKCFEVYRKMLNDPTCLIFIGLSGAMIPGGLRKVIRDMIEMKLVDVIVSTGANIFHDIYESLGYQHYVGSEDGDDDTLRRHRIVRVYDVLMDDDKINQVIYLLSKVPEGLEERVVSSRRYLEVLGSHLKDGESILRTASQHGVPVFVPALSDSSIGIGLTLLHAQKKSSSERLVIDHIQDSYEIAQLKRRASSTGAIYIGGGVPKNYIQQLGPVNELLFQQESGHRYAFQITTDDPKWGGLSGCTFEEAKSWGKIEKRSSYAAVYMDSTVALPLLVGAILQEGKAYRKRKRRQFIWTQDRLKSIQWA
ncbi:MAG: deoxyhypusine synthase family protein [Thermodesulfobacteriota bacterium]|nr:deoxyhypusine synthase family protein [Thermodesulfobacteriota bacterium]MDI7259912.1 deoxyhypusine synthase family protein [Thermodesulfobacteriota bacterium]